MARVLRRETMNESAQLWTATLCLQHQLQNLDSIVSRDGSKKEKPPFELHNMIQISDHVLKDPILKIPLSNYSLRTMESR